MRVFQAKAAALGRADATGDTYRYPGPRPRSRGTAIVMIADQVEATARAVPANDTSARHDVVRQTLARIQSAGQLDESVLTDHDFAAIEIALVRALAAMHHHRITYPRAVFRVRRGDRRSRA